MAIDTTKRRLASTISCFARWSPRSIRLASFDLLRGGQELDAADVLEEELERVGRELELEGLLGLGGVEAAAGLDRRLCEGEAGRLEVILEEASRRLVVVHPLCSLIVWSWTWPRPGRERPAAKAPLSQEPRTDALARG